MPNHHQNSINNLKQATACFLTLDTTHATSASSKACCDSFEFYHDEAGITTNKADFIAGIRDGLCKLPYKPRRQLVAGSLKVYPLYKKEVLYGAVQTGEHLFFAKEKDKPEYLTSTAKFTSVWLLENGQWKLSRVISYDHQKP